MKSKSVSISLFAYISIGILTTLLLVLVKIGFEVKYGHRIEAITYEFFQSKLSPFSTRTDNPVVVVDIGKMSGGTANQPTSRKDLKVIITTIATQKPKAIGIDIDFSPRNEGGWVDDDDPAFFDYCLNLSTEKGIPIFLGVDRSIGSSSEAWLGLEKYKSLATTVRVESPNTGRMILWTKSNESEEKLPSISLALSKSYRKILPQPPTWIAFALKEIPSGETTGHEKTNLDNDEFVFGKAIANHSKLELIESQSLATITANSIIEHADRFSNKIVLIGRIYNASDKINVVGIENSVSGVLLHASAVYTLTKEPLFEFTHTARIVIDLLLPLIILLFIGILRYRIIKNPKYNWHRIAKISIWVVSVLVIVGGIILVQWLQILWLDFFLVAIALGFHPLVEKYLVLLT